MLLSTFMEYALEGYGAVFKNGILERVPSVAVKRAFSHKRKAKPTKEENIQTIAAFIDAVKEKHGSLCSHLATLLLVETIQKKEMLSANTILFTYQTMLEIENVLKKDYSYFTKLPFPVQKDYMLLMAQSKIPMTQREKMSKAFMLQSLLSKGIMPSETIQ